MRASVLMLFIICVISCVASAQTFIKRPAESNMDFVKRNVPGGLSLPENGNDLYKQMFGTTEWTADTSVFDFYIRTYTLQGDDQEYEDVLGYLYVPVSKGMYKRVFIDTFENEGGTANIASIFFANADKDSARELVVMLQWPSRHYQIWGTVYETRIYDDLLTGQYPPKLTYLEKVSKKVSGDFDGDREGEKLVSKYKSSKEVRAELKRLGY